MCSGRYSASDGATVCSPCVAGRYSVAGSAVCSPCPLGTYQPATGAFACVECAANTYLDTSGATAASQCLACPPLAPLSPAASSSAVQCVPPQCPDGSFTPVGQLPCSAPCPRGRFCSGGVQSECPRGTASSAV